MRTNNGNILQDNFYIFSARCCVSPFTFLVLPFDTDLSVIKAGGGCGRKLAEPCLPHSAGTGDSLVTFVTLLHNCGGRIHNITGDQGQGQGTRRSSNSSKDEVHRAPQFPHRYFRKDTVMAFL